MSLAAPQRIVRIRREYNQWVANQTLEDYALRFTAKGARRWSPWRVANTALGAMSFLALEAIGGAITLNYGFTNALWAILVAGALIIASGLPIAYYAAKYGVDMDLLTRGAGFGYLGSTITSLIYASFTFIFFALEAAIMAMALELCFGLPLPAGYVLCAVLVIPLVTHGITLISRFQAWTQPLWLLLNLLPFAVIAWQSPNAFADWTTFTGRLGETQGHFDLLLFGSAASVVFALAPQIGEQVDFLRFLPRPRQTLRERAAWWTALVAAGPGWIVVGVLKMLAGSFLLFLAVQAMVPLDIVGEPVQMYLVAFREVFASPAWALAATTLFVIVAQLKINVTNAYAGSIAWSNFFARLTHSHPGRVVWLGFNVLIALVLMELGVFKALERILGLYANVAIAWIGAVVADLVVNKPLGWSPRHIEFKRAHLYDINPVGVGAMGFATVIALAAYAGLFGPVAQALSAFVAFGTALATAPLIAWVTRGRYYIARPAEAVRTQRTRLRCVVCEHRFEVEDMARCPAYGGWICSLCCSLDARCLDSCKPRARLRDQLLDGLRLFIPERGLQALDSRLGHYIGVYSLVLALIGGTLLLLGFQQSLEAPMPGASALLWKAFVVLALIAGVVSWLFVLAQESRRVAQQESTRQMQLLTREIQAHKRTDAQLKEAKEAAEAANLAKSRFVTGLSHELRTPLNAILGYAQLLDADRSLPEPAQDAARVIRRSGEHLSQLIDGLLDIAKIEAGKVHLHRDLLHFPSLVDELEMMFGPQARAKGIAFHVERPPRLPVHVQTDGKRLRQVLINLLTNAIKFTERGSVTLRLRYQRQTAEFQVIDTGPGIAAEDRERIFAPFERGRGSEAAGAPGMGLGLTISRVLTEIMGGQISVASEPGVGSTFSVRMVLGEVTPPAAGLPPPAARITGYAGPRRTVMVADDDADSRALLRRLLEPLGFVVMEATRGDTCLDAVRAAPPDVLLLDISMPGLNGWEVARRLRAGGLQELPIVMVSADAFENRQNRPGRQARASGAPAGHETCHDDFLVKPINLQQLLDALRRHLGLTWQVADDPPHPRAGPAGTPHRPAIPPPSTLTLETLDELDHLVAIGHVRGLLDRLDALSAEQPAGPDTAGPDPAHDGRGPDAARIAVLRRAVREFRLADFQRELAGLRAAALAPPCGAAPDAAADPAAGDGRPADDGDASGRGPRADPVAGLTAHPALHRTA